MTFSDNVSGVDCNMIIENTEQVLCSFIYSLVFSSGYSLSIRFSAHVHSGRKYPLQFEYTNLLRTVILIVTLHFGLSC